MKRVLTLLDSTMINVGTIIGSGIFLVPTTIALYLHSSILTVAVWLVAGVVTLFGALSMAELGAAMPKAGGQFIYLRQAYGPLWGFLYGWGSFTVINSAAIAALAIAFATYLGYFNPLTPFQIKLIAVLTITAFTGLNTYGVKTAVWTQNMLTFLKIGALLAIATLGLSLPGGEAANFQPLLTTHSVTSLIGPFGLALMAVLWSYDGWIEITYIGGEVQNPGRNIPLSLLLSVLLIVAIYIVVNLVFIYLLSIPGIAGSELVASDAVAVVLGGFGTTLVILAILVSTLGGVHVNVLACPRIYYAMAKEGVFFQALSRIHPRFGTPAISLLVQGIWSSLLVFSGTFEQLITYVVFASWIFYAMSCAGVIILRRKQPELERPYKTWGYPWVPLTFIVFAALLVLNTIVNDPRDALIGLALLLTGVPAYAYWRR